MNKILLVILISLGTAGIMAVPAFAKSAESDNQNGSIQVVHPSALSSQNSAQDFEDWDPFLEMEHMHQAMRRMMGQSMRRMWGDAPSPRYFQPDADIRDFDNQYVIRMDLPGMSKDQIRVDVTENAVSISGERREEKREENVREGTYRMERNFGTFHRAIPLDEPVKTEEVQAKYENGVLEITLPKLEVKKTKAKSIAIQ